MSGGSEATGRCKRRPVVGSVELREILSEVRILPQPADFSPDAYTLM